MTETEFRNKTLVLRDALLDLNRDFWGLRSQEKLQGIDEELIYKVYTDLAKFCQTLPHEKGLIAKFLETR